MTAIVKQSSALDLAEFICLPQTVQDEISAWRKLLESVNPPVQRALQTIADKMGVSFQTARAKYYAWKNAAQDWRVLINRAKVPEKRGLHPDLIEYWRKLCSENSRSHLAAYREFVRRWKNGAAIPGLDPHLPRHVMPPGCKYDNLMRHKPTKYETKAARIGRSAAAPFRPKLFTDRTGMAVGHRYIFDDMWHDFKVVHVGQRKPLRLLQLHAHDLASACQFARGLKARVEDESTGKSVNLNQGEMNFLLASVLHDFGFHKQGTILMVEHGTAAIPEDLEKLLFDISGGLIRVERSGMEGAAAFAGQYPGRGKGNFRFKASLESLGNLIHNETANLLQFPGQTGSNSRLNVPEELAGREKHAIALEMALLALPVAMREKLVMPFLEVNTAKVLVHEIMERINARTEHELQGWIECGHTTTDLILPLALGGSGNLPGAVSILSQAQYLALTPPQRLAIDAIATPQVRKLSPREVFNTGRAALVKFRPEQIAALLQSREGQEVSVGDDHLITFEDQSVSPSPLRYLAHTRAPGDKFRAVVNPWSPEVIHLFDARGAWVGTASEWQRPSPDDTEALHAQMGHAAKIEKQLLAPLARRGAELTRQRIAAAQTNIGGLREEVGREADLAALASDILRERNS